MNGTVTVKGEPAPEGTLVTFTPVDPTLQSAQGRTDPSGNYTLFTGIQGTPGAIPGEYNVSLAAPTSDDYMTSDAGRQRSSEPKKDTSVIPEEWTGSSTTPKKGVQVTAGKNMVPIEVP